MQLNLYEVFDKVAAAPFATDKINILRNNESPALLEFLKGVYNPGVKFTVKSLPKYKPSDAPVGMAMSTIDMELRRAYLFQENHPKRPKELTETRTNQILIQVLESLEARESELFGNMLLKKLDVPGISKLLVETAFPGKI